MMKARIDPFTAAPEILQSWIEPTNKIIESLESSLVKLVILRASQINSCGNCLNAHAYDARTKGESEERIYLLSAWRDAPYYTSRERAALQWTEALTQLADGHPREDVVRALEAEFSPEEQVKLTLLINAINGWNRIAVGFGIWKDLEELKAT